MCVCGSIDVLCIYAAVKGKREREMVSVLQIPPLVCAGLCAWQLQRAEEKKQELSARRRALERGDGDDDHKHGMEAEDGNARVRAAVAACAAKNEADATMMMMEYTPLRLIGRFVSPDIAVDASTQGTNASTVPRDDVVFIGPRPKTSMGVAQKGYLMISPMRLGGGGEDVFVLVNRGWVPDAFKRAKEACNSCDMTMSAPSSKRSSSASKASSTSSTSSSWFSYLGSFFSGREHSTGADACRERGTVIECVVRNSEKRGRFTPDNSPSSRDWFWIDRAGIADHLRLDPASTVLVEEVDGIPGGCGGAAREDTQEDAQEIRAIPRRKMPAYPERRSYESLIMATGTSVEGHYGYAAIWGSLAVAIQFIASGIKRRPRPL